MNTELLSLSRECYDASLNRAADILKAGGIVAIPTETVYGLAARACDGEAVRSVFAAKGRPQDNPLIVHVSDLEQLSEVCREIPDIAYRLGERFWPGPFTMILKRGKLPCENVCAGMDTVAVRMPSHPVARDLIRLAGPLAAPSANLSGAPSPTRAEHVVADLSGKIPGILMGGECEVGVESTVITLCTEPPRLLRPGGITPEQIAEILPDLVIDPAVLADPGKNARVASPGMKYKHYAPKTDVYLVEGTDQAFAAYVNGLSDVCAFCFSEEKDRITIPCVAYGSAADEATLARSVFDLLREADSYGKKAIYIHAPSKTGIGLAVYNRLIRAAAFRVITL